MEKKLECKNYTTYKALSIIKKIELINKREFASMTLDINIETFMIYIATLSTILVI